MAMTKYELVNSIQLDDCLYATADAIREKTKTDGTITFDFENRKGFAEAIEAISTDRTLIQFKDYDGQLIRAYTLEEIQSMSELPDAPIHENLTFIGWTKTLEALKNYPYSVNVYPKYRVTDGKTRIWISFTSTNKAPTLRFVQSKSQGLLFDWGDGTQERVSGTGNLTKQHTYAGIGSYVITITPDADCMWTPNWGGSSNNIFISGYASSIIAVEFGDNVSALGAYAFYNASALRTLLLPEGITEIPDNFCYGCSALQYVTIPSTVEIVRTAAFNSCISIEQLDISDTLTTIYQQAFSACHGLKKVFISANCINVNVGSSNSAWLAGNQLISAGPYGTNKAIEYGWAQLPNYAFNYNQYLTEVMLPPNCTVIPSYAFSNCTSLPSIELPKGITSIGNSAFYNCGQLKTVVIPDGVTTINSSSFSQCYQLEKLIIPASVVNFSTGNNPVFSGCPKLKTASPIGEGGNIEYGWDTQIPPYAFSTTNLEDVSFPETLTVVGGFYNCYYLKSLEIPASVNTIDSYAFYTCRNLETVTGTEGIIAMNGSNNFASCQAIKTLNLPKVTYIVQAAFSNMVALENITLGSIDYGVTYIRNDAFSYTYNPNLNIEIYTTSSYVDSLLANTRNGAVSATIIIKASQDTVYHGVTYSAGDIILTSTP